MGSGLQTDLYELTMMQGYFLHGLNPPVVFDMFFRRQPWKGGFAVFAGLDPLLDELENLRFDDEDLDYLSGLNIFDPAFLSYLGKFRFGGDIYAADEGSIIFPNEPLIRVHSRLIEAQLIESLLLNIINFQTLRATKTARICLDGALSASRAACIGGAAATSNTRAGKEWGIPVRGTMAHSWVMAYPNEQEAFIRYAQIFPDNAILLIDTYDTLKSGLPNAIRVFQDLEKEGHTNYGIRLDSGDLEYLSKQCRRSLDDNGLFKARITVSNELDEKSIQVLTNNGYPIDIWGVGTHLVTAKGDPALSGVYKLAAKLEGGRYVPVLKVSENSSKTTDPGVKQVYRCLGEGGRPLSDLITLDSETVEPGMIPSYGPHLSEDCVSLDPLLCARMKKGRRLRKSAVLSDVQEKMRKGLDALDPEFKRLSRPRKFRVTRSRKLRDLKKGLKEALTRDFCDHRQ